MNNKTCTCGRPARVKGMCFKCYNKDLRQRNPEKAKANNRLNHKRWYKKTAPERTIRKFFIKMSGRPFIVESIKDLKFIRTYKCSKCKEEKSRGGHFIDGKIYCKSCVSAIEEWKTAQEILNITRAQDAIDKLDPVGDLKNTCTKLGTCDILHFHHELLKDDPERLSSDFMIKMICGEDKVQRYREQKAAKALEVENG